MDAKPITWEPSYDGEEILGEVRTFATQWFLNHIRRKDIEYLQFVKQAPPPDGPRKS